MNLDTRKTLRQGGWATYYHTRDKSTVTWVDEYDRIVVEITECDGQSELMIDDHYHGKYISFAAAKNMAERHTGKRLLNMIESSTTPLAPSEG